MKRRAQWFAWLILTATIAIYFGWALMAPASSIKASLLPGKTTHGHYQIELQCNACHAPVADDESHTATNVMQDACIGCHGEQLRQADDTHPAKKFNDPVNAELLLTLDAQNCLTCHAEHVPEQTREMGLTMPDDYCWHCHQDVAESRPSHEGMSHQSCATAGCHNYHDNMALYEKFLSDHYGEPDFLETAVLVQLDSSKLLRTAASVESLTLDDADADESIEFDGGILTDWVQTAHAAAGVNCSGCHGGATTGQPWMTKVPLETCGGCHEGQLDGFFQGKHGMRLAVGLSAMRPEISRSVMHAQAHGRELQCNACHDGHRFNTDYASAEACLKCHSDKHSMAWSQTSHAKAWMDETHGDGPKGSGVSCATCHMPRITQADGTVTVQHDQSANLRPNEKMVREVCMNCHGLEFSLSSLADPASIETCFGDAPTTQVDSVQMAHDWFAAREAERNARMKKRQKKKTVKTPTTAFSRPSSIDSD